MVAAEVSVSLADLEKLLLEGKGARFGRSRCCRVSDSVGKLYLHDAETLTLQRLMELTKFVSISEVI